MNGKQVLFFPAKISNHTLKLSVARGSGVQIQSGIRNGQAVYYIGGISPADISLQEYEGSWGKEIFLVVG